MKKTAPIALAVAVIVLGIARLSSMPALPTNWIDSASPARETAAARDGQTLLLPVTSDETQQARSTEGCAGGPLVPVADSDELPVEPTVYAQ